MMMQENYFTKQLKFFPVLFCFSPEFRYRSSGHGKKESASWRKPDKGLHPLFREVP
jgi:hypothetical protein